MRVFTTCGARKPCRFSFGLCSCCVFGVALPMSDSGLKCEATRHIIYYIGVMNNPFDGYVCFSG